MSLSFRAFIVAAFTGLSVWFLWPSWTYFFQSTPEIREMVESGGLLSATNSMSPDTLERFQKASDAKAGAVALGLDIRGGILVVLDADFEKLAAATGTNLDAFDEKYRADALDRVIHKVQNRIDEFGLSEVSVRKQGTSRIVIQIPGERDTTRIKSIIDRVGQLEFHIVDEENMRSFPFDPKTKEPLSTNVPAGSKVYWFFAKNEATGKYERRDPILLGTNVVFSGERVKDARPSIGQYGDVQVSFGLDSKGASQFSDVTGTYKGRRMAIVLDGRVMSAPTLQDRIAGGQGVITGNFTQLEAKDLSIILRSGSLPVPVKMVSEEIIGPTMGMEALRRSITALVVSILVILAFMMVRYRLIGVIATAALVMNALLIFAILAPLKFTVSLPGIAGLILTLGMAIDANVLINERIRDELYKEKRSLFDAITRGYDRAFWTIIDSHVTGLISAFILANFGEGPVKGFAVTLFIGIVVSLFTALFVTRFLVDLLIRWRVIRGHNMLVI